MTQYRAFKDLALEYLEGLSARAQEPRSIEAIRHTIAKQGYWEETVEWRISTITSTRIEAVQQEGNAAFRVHVSCDSEMIAICPTVERAVEFAGIFAGLQQDLFWTVGWPSWEARDRLKSE